MDWSSAPYATPATVPFANPHQLPLPHAYPAHAAYHGYAAPASQFGSNAMAGDGFAGGHVMGNSGGGMDARVLQHQQHQQHQHNQQQHQQHEYRPVAGTKRQATDDLRREQPLTKRLERLSIRQAAAAAAANSPRHPPTPPTSPPSTAGAASGRMEVDDVVYVPTLDDSDDDDDDDADPELSALPREKRGLVFLSDIEKRLTRIPDRVLRPDAPTSVIPGLSGVPLGGFGGRGIGSLAGGPAEGVGCGGSAGGGELVLWQSVPKTLTASSEGESVRKAIVEARRRARMKAEVEAAAAAGGGGGGSAGAATGANGKLPLPPFELAGSNRVWEVNDDDEMGQQQEVEMADPDAMDIE